MVPIEKRIRELEKENKEQAVYIEFLKEDIEGLKKSREVLKKSLLEEKVQFSRFVRQGLKFRDGNEFYGWHYVVFPISGIPLTLEIEDVKEMIKETLSSELKMSKFKDYILESIDYSERKQIWYAQIGKVIKLNLE
jgi:hypothetical protein